MLPSIQAMDDVVLNLTDMMWILAKMDGARESYMAKRNMGSGRRERVLEFCMPLQETRGSASTLPYKAIGYSAK